MSLYVSPPSSENGGTPKINARPEINLKLIQGTRKKRFIPPEGVFSQKEHRPTLESRYWGNAPFFTNAKPAAMLERGYIQSLTLIRGQRGLLTIKDGPEMQIEVVEGLHWVPESNNNVYTVKDLSSSDIFDLPLISKHEEWEFYIATRPIPFIPRVPRGVRGGSTKRKNKRSKTRGRRLARRKA
jgi:hypothetical protein